MLSEAEELELLELESEEAAAQQAPAAAPMSEQEMRIAKTKDLLGAVPRGLTQTVDFMTGLAQKPNLDEMPNRADMSFRGFKEAQQKIPWESYESTIPKIMDQPVAQKILGQRVPRGIEGNEVFDAANFGLEFLGGGGRSPAKLATIASGAASAGDYISNLLSDSGGKTTGTLAGISTLLFHPFRAGKELLKKNAASVAEQDPMKILRSVVPEKDIPAVEARLKQAAESGEEGKTLSQLMPENKEIAALEQHFRQQMGGDAKNAFRIQDEALSAQPATYADEITDANANIENIKEVAQNRVATVGDRVTSREAGGLEKSIQDRMDQQRFAREAADEQNLIAEKTQLNEIAKEQEGLAQTIAANDEAAALASVKAGETTRANTVQTPTAETSKGMRQATEAANDEAKLIENRLWDEVPPDETILTDTVKNAADRAKQILNDTEVQLSKIESDDIAKFINDKMGGKVAVSPRELASVRSEISTKLRALDKQPNPSAALNAYYKNLNTELMGVLESGASGPAYRNAIEFTKRRNDLLERSSVGKARKQGDNTFGEKAVGTGNQALDDLENIEKIGGALPAATADNFTAQFSQASRQGGKGFNDAAAQSFIDTNEPALRQLGLYDKMKSTVDKNAGATESLKSALTQNKAAMREADQNISTVKQEVKITQGEIEANKKAQLSTVDTRQKEQAQRLREKAKEQKASLEKSPAQQVAKAEPDKIGQEVSKVLDSKTSIKDMKQLVKTAKKDKTGDGVGALKRTTIEHVLKKMTGGDGLIKSDAVEIFSKYRRSMLDSKLFSEQEIAKLAGNIEDAKLIYTTKNVSPANVPEAQKTWAYVAGALFGAKVGGKVLNAPLIGANLGKTAGVEVLHKIPALKAKKALQDILMNPAKYKRQFLKADTEEKMVDLLLDIMQMTGRVKGSENKEE